MTVRVWGADGQCARVLGSHDNHQLCGESGGWKGGVMMMTTQCESEEQMGSVRGCWKAMTTIQLCGDSEGWKGSIRVIMT